MIIIYTQQNNNDQLWYVCSNGIMYCHGSATLVWKCYRNSIYINDKADVIGNPLIQIYVLSLVISIMILEKCHLLSLGSQAYHLHLINKGNKNVKRNTGEVSLLR